MKNLCHFALHLRHLKNKEKIIFLFPMGSYVKKTILDLWWHTKKISGKGQSKEDDLVVSWFHQYNFNLFFQQDPMLIFFSCDGDLLGFLINKKKKKKFFRGSYKDNSISKNNIFFNFRPSATEIRVILNFWMKQNYHIKCWGPPK